MGKGEIAHYEQFILFPHCFQKACFPGASKGVIVWEWVKIKRNGLIWNRKFMSHFHKLTDTYQSKCIVFNFAIINISFGLQKHSKVQNCINPFPNKPSFLHVCSTFYRLKTQWEKEILFIPFWELSTIFIKFRIVICKIFHFGRTKNLSFWERLKVVF